MNRLTVVLTIFAIIVLGGLAMTISTLTGGISVAEASSIITIELKESLTFTDSVRGLQ